MEVVKLTKEQVSTIYNERMIDDFPPDERKPLAMLFAQIDSGHYDCLGLEDDGHILGYAYFYRVDRIYLFDYLAIEKSVRDKGIGSIFLSKLSEYMTDAEAVIGEVEDFEKASNEKTKAEQLRRYNFYLKNGCHDTGVTVNMYGVDYRTLEAKVSSSHDSNYIRKIYSSIYKTMLPDKLYKDKVKIY